jgi:hypothetical protein
MSRREVIECDRCGAIDSDTTRDRDAWGMLYAATVAGDDVVGSAEKPVDLCGECLSELRTFFGPVVAEVPRAADSDCRLCGVDLSSPSAAGAEDGICGACIDDHAELEPAQ